MSQLSLWTEEDQSNLDHHEQVIERGFQYMVETANSLREIRDSRLYRKEFETFEQYCHERWGKTRRWAYNLIGAALVVEQLNVNPGSHLPSSERQVRPLSKLESPEEKQEAWDDACENAKTEGKPTSKEVSEAVAKIQQRNAELEKQLAIAQRDYGQLKTQLTLAKSAYKEELTTRKAADARLSAYRNAEAERISTAKQAAYDEAKTELEQDINSANASVTALENKIKDLKANPDPDMRTAIAKLEQDKRLASNELTALNQRRLEVIEELQKLEDDTAEEQRLVMLARAFQKACIEQFEEYGELGLTNLPPLAIDAVSEGLDTLAQLRQHIARNLPGDRQNIVPIKAIEVEVG